jgi:integrase
MKNRRHEPKHDLPSPSSENEPRENSMKTSRLIWGEPQYLRVEREQKANGYSNASVNRSIASIRKMFTLAARDGKLRHLPFFPMLKESRPKQGVLARDKYQQLVEALPSYLKLPVIIAFHTGMRRAEILNLTWSNIKFMDRVVEIEESKNGEAAPFHSPTKWKRRSKINSPSVRLDAIVCVIA